MIVWPLLREEGRRLRFKAILKEETKKYKRSFNPDDIKAYLSKFRKFILDGKYISIAQNENRQENIDFIRIKNRDKKKKKEILLVSRYSVLVMQLIHDNEEIFSWNSTYSL